MILCNYGFWLPNVPRGSWSRFVRAPNIRRHGPATTIGMLRSRAAPPPDRQGRELAKADLVRPPVACSDVQARSVARGFARRIAAANNTVYACTILPDHSHLAIRRHRYDIEPVVRALRQEATLRLRDEGLHPFADQRLASGRLPSVWRQGFWKVFLFDGGEVRRSIMDTDENPARAGLWRESWSFSPPFVDRHPRHLRCVAHRNAPARPEPQRGRPPSTACVRRRETS